MTDKTNLILTLAALSLADLVIPFPVLGATLLYVVVKRPAWFKKLVRDVYGAA